MQILTLAGTVGKDAELRNSPDRDSVLNFSLAVDNGKDKPATWYDCSIWGKRATSLQSHIGKGDRLSVSGRPSVRVHDGKAYLGITVSELSFMGRAKGRGDDAGRSDLGPQGGASHDDEIPF